MWASAPPKKVKKAVKMSNAKNLAWLAFCAVLLAAISAYTGVQAQNFKLDFLALSALFFLASTVFWGFAWSEMLGQSISHSIAANTKALVGFLTPFGLGADALRALHARGTTPAAALSASLVVKFFKLLLSAAVLAAAMSVLAQQGWDFNNAFLIFATALAFTLATAVLILCLKTPRAGRILSRLLNRVSVLRFRRAMTGHFLSLSAEKTVSILFFLGISTLLELAAVGCAFLSVGQEMPLNRVFVAGAAATSFALVSITPQGAGFVEAGMFFLLQLGFFSLKASVIGSFLVAWGLVRIFIPAVIGAAASLISRD